MRNAADDKKLVNVVENRKITFSAVIRSSGQKFDRRFKSNAVVIMTFLSQMQVKRTLRSSPLSSRYAIIPAAK